MKILFFVNRLAKGGSQRLVLDICNALNNKKDVEYIVAGYDSVYEYEEYKSLVDYKVLNVSVKLSFLKKNIIKVDELQQLIESFKPDIIHSHLFIADIISRSCQYNKAVWFSHCHDNMPQYKKLTIKTIFNKTLLTNYFERIYMIKRFKVNGGNNFITISKDTDHYFKINFNKFPIYYLKNAIDYNKFYKPIRLINNLKKINIINVGSFQKKKNQTFLIDIAKVLIKRKIQFEMNLYGDGNELNNVKQLILKNKLDLYIKTHGKVSSIEKKMWEADFYLHTAYYEPLGLVLLEAMAAGLPVICLDGKGNRDIIVNEKNGFMIEEQNPELFADKIIDLWNNPKKHYEIASFAQNFAKRYDIKDYVDKLLEIYQEKISDKKI